jgi:hypothetical protein
MMMMFTLKDYNEGVKKSNITDVVIDYNVSV